MTRIHRQRVPSAPAGASRHSRALEQKTKAPYRVIFEPFTARKRKLITRVSYEMVCVADELAVDPISPC